MRRRLILFLLSAIVILFIFWPYLIGFPRGEPIVVKLEIEGNREFAAGTPLSFNVYLSSDKAATLGTVFKPWHTFITLSEEDGDSLSWTMIELEKPYGFFFEKSAQGIKQKRSEGAIARFDGSLGYYHYQLTLSPEESAKLSEGKRAIKASLEATRFPFWGRRVFSESAPLSMRITKRVDTPDAEVVLQNAKFYLRAKRYAEALALSEGLIKLSQKRADPYIVRGDALVGLGNKKEALGAYQHALTLVPRAYEEPLALMQRIQRLEVE